MKEKKVYKLQGKIASISTDFVTRDITIHIPDGIEICGVKQNSTPCGIQGDRNIYPTEKFIIKEVIIPEKTYMENARCFDNRMFIHAW